MKNCLMLQACESILEPVTHKWNQDSPIVPPNVVCDLRSRPESQDNENDGYSTLNPGNNKKVVGSILARARRAS